VATRVRSPRVVKKTKVSQTRRLAVVEQLAFGRQNRFLRA
jgi:hypothetical protein